MKNPFSTAVQRISGTGVLGYIFLVQKLKYVVQKDKIFWFILPHTNGIWTKFGSIGFQILWSYNDNLDSIAFQKLKIRQFSQCIKNLCRIFTTIPLRTKMEEEASDSWGNPPVKPLIALQVLFCLVNWTLIFFWIHYENLSVQISHSVIPNSLQPHGLQRTRLPCLSPTPGAYSNSCPSRQWCYPTISSSVIPFSSPLQSFSASGSFPLSRFFTSGGQSIGVSASACLSNEYSGLLSFRMEWLDLLAVQGTLKSLLQHHISKASILWLKIFPGHQISIFSCS